MNRLWKGFFTIVLLTLIAGCGSGSATTGNGTTVSVTAGISTGTAGSVFGNFSTSITGTSVFVANPMSITLTSTALNQTGTVPISPVNIVRITTALTPLPYTSIPANTTNALSPAIPNPQFANNPQGVGGVIPGPGTLKIDGIDIVGLSDAGVILPVFLGSGLSNAQYHYLATLTFFCVEANSGAQFTVSEPVGVEIDLQ